MINNIINIIVFKWLLLWRICFNIFKFFIHFVLNRRKSILLSLFIINFFCFLLLFFRFRRLIIYIILNRIFTFSYLINIFIFFPSEFIICFNDKIISRKS